MGPGLPSGRYRGALRLFEWRILTPTPSRPDRAESSFWEARSQERRRWQIWLSALGTGSRRRGSRPHCTPWGLAIRSLPVEDGKRPAPRNRFTTPSDMNLITANGVPAFVVEFNTPLDSRELVRSHSDYFADHVRLTPSLSLDLGAFADFSRGSLPAQSSPAGAFTPERTVAAQSDLIVWNNLSPRAGFGWQVPHSHGLVLRGTYFRSYEPLAGRLPRLRESEQPWRKRISMDRRQFHQPVSSRRTRQSAPTLRRTVLLNFAGPPPALLGSIRHRRRVSFRTASHREPSSVSPRRQESYRRHRYRRAGPGLHAGLHPRSGA